MVGILFGAMFFERLDPGIGGGDADADAGFLTINERR